MTTTTSYSDHAAGGTFRSGKIMDSDGSLLMMFSMMIMIMDGNTA